MMLLENSVSSSEEQANSSNPAISSPKRIPTSSRDFDLYLPQRGRALLKAAGWGFPRHPINHPPSRDPAVGFDLYL
jgi:hypothetical protein